MAVGSADQQRPDLAVLGLGRTNFGFVLLLPAGLKLDLAHVELRVVGEQEGLPIPESSAMAEGVIESVVGTLMSGWAWRVGRQGHRAPLIVRKGGEVIGRTVANRPRPDLAAAGIGDGRHAFAIDLGPLGATGDDDLEVIFDTGEPLHRLFAPSEPGRSAVDAELRQAPGPVTTAALETATVSASHPSGKSSLSPEAVEALMAAINLGEDEGGIRSLG